MQGGQNAIMQERRQAIRQNGVMQEGMNEGKQANKLRKQ